jgi:hypothetical protein
LLSHIKEQQSIVISFSFFAAFLRSLQYSQVTEKYRVHPKKKAAKKKRDMNSSMNHFHSNCCLAAYSSPSVMRKSKPNGGNKRVRFADERASFGRTRLALPYLPSKNDLLPSQAARVERYISDSVFLAKTASACASSESRISSDSKLNCRWQSGSSLVTPETKSLQNSTWQKHQDSQPFVPHRRSSTINQTAPPRKESTTGPPQHRQSDTLIKVPCRQHSMDMGNLFGMESPHSVLSLNVDLLEELDCPLTCPVRRDSSMDLDEACVAVSS